MFPDVMVDIETGGTSPDHSPILQIAAVRFNVLTGEVDASDMFNACLDQPADRFWDEGTVVWWQEQNPAVLERILSRAEPAEGVIRRFRDWSVAGYPDPVFWAKPITFDFPFIASYMRRYGFGMPYHFSKARDVRSFCAGLAFPNPPISDRDIAFEGDAHDAIFDVLHQIKYVLRVAQERRQGIVG